MKLLLKFGIVVVLVVSGYWYMQENLADKIVVTPPITDLEEETPVGNFGNSETKTKTELDAIFTYLPFLGFKFEDVIPVNGEDLYAVAGKRFAYESNVLEVYQLESSASATDLINQVKESMKVKRTVNGKSTDYVAITMNRYLCLIIEVNDPVSLLESYEFAKKTMKNLGMNFE